VSVVADEIVWATELPPASVAHRRLVPGEWARVRHYDNERSCRRIATSIRADKRGPLVEPPPGIWDAASRNDGHGGAWLWIKYEPIIDRPLLQVVQ
jgi:hypothetical protein